MIFSYEVVDRLGNILKGHIHAEHDTQAVQRLKENGYLVIQVKSKGKSKSSVGLFSRNKKITAGDKTIFSRQLAAMLNAGIPITRSVYTLSKQTDNPSFKKILENIARNVESGMSVSNAFSDYPSIFNDMYLGMIQAGEVGGTLGETLVRLSDQMQKEKVLKDSIRSATIYPISVASFAVVMLLGMLIFLVPIFQGFFPEGIDIPLASRIVISLSQWIRSYWYIGLVATSAIVGLIYLYSKTDIGSITIEKLRFNIPAFGPLFHKTAIARLARTFSTLFSNGIPVIQALETSGKSTGSKLIGQAIQDAITQIQEGKNIGETFEQQSIFPPIVSHMIMVGEETGSLPSLLDKIAEFYEDEVKAISKSITSMIEPVLLIFVGIIVGGMLISLYLPIFTVITQTICFMPSILR